jgi:predicted DNA-binding protein (UPF0251 family)
MKQISTVEIRLDQFEAMRLCDVEGLDQTEAGEKLKVSRGTVQRLLYEGRRLLMGAMLENAAIVVNLNSKEVNDDSMRPKQRRRRAGQPA